MTQTEAVLADGYVLGTDDIELGRLGLQHRIWADAASAIWRRAGLVPGMRVLDIGCGPGFASLDMAAIAGPTGRIVGVDESPRFVEAFNAQAAARGTNWAGAYRGDVHDIASALAACGVAGLFDMAYARWVLCFVPDPARVLRSAAALLRPGGRLCVQDYFCYASMSLAPKEPAFTEVITAIDRSWRDRGGDPDIVGRLPVMLDEAGFRLTSLEVDHRIARPGSTMWTWPTVFWASVLPRLVASGHITSTQRAAFEVAWARAGSDPTRFCLLPPVFDVIAERV